MKKMVLGCLLGVGLVAGLLSCGKVTQDASTVPEAKTYDFAYGVSVLSSADYKTVTKRFPSLPTASMFTTQQGTVFAQVSGIDKQAKRQELSWGRSVLSMDWVAAAGLPVSSGSVTMMTASASATAPTMNLLYSTASFRKDGVKLTQSDAGWTKVSFSSQDQGTLSWKAESKKIRKEFPFYLVALYAHDGLFALRVVAEQSISKNQQVDLGQISRYDTFIASLFLVDFADKRLILDDPASLDVLMRLYDQSFFQVLNPPVPKNGTKRFDTANPSFLFEGDMEKELLTVFQLVVSKGYDEAIRYVEALKQPVFTRQIKDKWILAIRSLK